MKLKQVLNIIFVQRTILKPGVYMADASPTSIYSQASKKRERVAPTVTRRDGLRQFKSILLYRY